MHVGRLGWGVGLLALLACAQGADESVGRRARPAAAVEVAPVLRGPIALERTFSGSLEAQARVEVSARISGQVAQIAVDLGDIVRPGQLLVRLDGAELGDQLAQASADLEVARARSAEAVTVAAFAKRELGRVQELLRREVATPAELDAAQADADAKRAAANVAQAQVVRAEAARDGAMVRLGYTRVVADWQGPARVVAARHVDQGATVAAHDSLLTVVQLDPLRAVVSVPERDYPFMKAGLRARVRTDAFSDEVFTATVARVAPAFDISTRQARVELVVPNRDGWLAPGMFARVEVGLREVSDAVLVPKSALTARDDVVGVFVVDDEGTTVRWQPVELGVETPARAQLLAPDLVGARVVVSGQHLVDDGAPITIPEASAR